MYDSQGEKNQARIIEHKILVWRSISCLARQDCIYTNLVRKSRSAFPGKNLVEKEWRKNLDWKSRKTRTCKERCQDRRLVQLLLQLKSYLYTLFFKRYFSIIHLPPLVLLTKYYSRTRDCIMETKVKYFSLVL